MRIVGFSWAILLCLLSIGCGDVIIVKEQRSKVEAGTFQVWLQVDDAAFLPPLLVFEDESPREAARKGRTENMTIEEVVRSRYPIDKYEILEVERTSNRYYIATMRKKVP